MRSPSERVPCSACGCGIIGGHMKRHAGSKVCALNQKRMLYTRDILSPLYRMAERMEQLSQDMVKLAEELKRA